jgi:predicted nucleic acid-binding protein
VSRERGAGQAAAASVLLDSEGLAALLRADRSMIARLEAARRARALVCVSVVTVVGAVCGRTDQARLDWVLSRLNCEDVTLGDAKTAVSLLRAAGGSRGRSHAIDALVAALALRLPGRTVVLTSDPGDWRRLVGDGVRVVSL